MRASSAIAAVLTLLMAGCASLRDPQVHVVVFNDSPAAQRLQISVDGDRVLDLLPAVTQTEPSIVSTLHLHLRPGAHRIEVTRDTIVHRFTFIVRAATRTDVRVHLQNGEITFETGYGEAIYL
jgi:hypothetical protein